MRDQTDLGIDGNYVGLSTHAKPAAPAGTLFTERDTGRVFVRRNVGGSDTWVRLNAELDDAGLLEVGVLRHVTASYNAGSPPLSSGTAVTVPTTSLFRVVFGNYNLTGATLAQAGISASVSTPETPTTYASVSTASVNALQSGTPAFSFIVRPGGKYYFAPAGTGATETVGSYNFLDVVK